MDREQPAIEPSPPDVASRDLATGLRGLLLLDIITRLFVWSWALGISLWISARFLPLPPAVDATFGLRAGLAWAAAAVRFVLVFNVVYILLLMALRSITPTPREGRYSSRSARLDRQVLYSGLLACLTKARMHAPFPGFLVFQLSNLPPLCWLFGWVFGPRSRSAFIVDPQILDPHMVTIGRNVIVGFGATIAGHYQDRDGIVIAKTVIEDDVLIGAHASVAGGVRIGRGAVLAAHSFVLPRTEIGPGEVWSGNPARRRRGGAADGEVA